MFWKIVFLLAIVFVLTYDPKSRTLEKLLVSPHLQQINRVNTRITKPFNLLRHPMIALPRGKLRWV